jgi:hypothetical protein
MNEAEFLGLAETCGADLSRWPQASQLPAARLLRDSPACRAAIADAEALDALLWDGRPTIAPERVRQVAARIAAVRQERIAASAAHWPISRRTTGLFLASMLLLGISIGLLEPVRPVAQQAMLDPVPAEGLFGGFL